MSAAEELMEQLEGAQIATAFVENDEGLHICFRDGRVLVIAGHFGLSILKSEILH